MNFVRVMILLNHIVLIGCIIICFSSSINIITSYIIGITILLMYSFLFVPVSIHDWETEGRK